MKILGFNISREKRAVGDAIITTPYDSQSMGLTFGLLNQQNTAMAISAVYRATELISDSVAMLPIQVKAVDETNHKNIVTNHPVYQAFDAKNNLLDKFTFMKMLIQSVILRGNGFAYIERNSDGSVKSLRFLESGDVTIKYHKGRHKLYYVCPIITKANIEPINMIHLFKNSYDGINGVSVLSFANRAIKNAQNTENSALKFFENGCNLSGVLTVESSLTPQQRKDIRASWAESYGVGGNGLAVLQGNMKYQPIQLNASDSQLIQSRQYNVQDIARFFGINPVLLGDLTHSSYSTLEAAQNEFLLHTLQPYIVMVESEFSKKMLKPSESNLIINLDETYLLKTDKTAQASYYNTLLLNGVLCINEVRRELGYSEIEGGDKHIIAYTDVNQNQINQNQNEQGNS